ncbi:MAG: ATP-dependent RecD-like DNA helicase [Atopostipes suicloacalis]|nr:ATP-dependent RecD-like DNA helicase [Atopostipes suicloacalis]
MKDASLNLNNQEELYIIAEVQAIYFSSPSNYYKVILVEVKETNGDYSENNIVITGNFGRIQESSSYKFYGNFTNHPKYGMQFNAKRYETSQPSTTSALISYLSGPSFKGVGKKSAERIVEKLGVHSIDRIVEDATALNQVDKLSKKQKNTIEEVVVTEYGMQKIILSLNKYGIDNTLAYRIYGKYKEETDEVIQENPYQLIKDIEGISFKRADAIAEQLDIAPDAPERIQAGILYVLNSLSNNTGDTYSYKEPLIAKTIYELEKSQAFLIDESIVLESLETLLIDQLIYEEADRYSLASLYYAEWSIVNSLDNLLLEKVEKIPKKTYRKKIKALEKELGIHYGASQKEAIKEALESSIFILTGGPGTGKTTVLEGIVHLYAELNDLSLDPYSYKDRSFPILLAAPTGRAAKRMKETTELPASTIHRMLGLTADEEDLLEDNGYRLDGDLLIIDEMSMVDTFLANQLFHSIPQGMKVILVGDQDQLPSVGPGQVFRDLIESNIIPQKELVEIYRQEDDSSIIELSHKIKNDHLPKDLLDRKSDRNFFPARTSNAVAVIERIVEKAIQRGYTSNDIQVLAPMYKGVAGINILNERLQEIFNPNDGTRTEVKYINQVYRIGDKVLQLQNDPENNVFNGDIGIIVGINKANQSGIKTDEIIVDFDSNEVSYLRSNWKKITLAYCCSIHKAQGSEYDIVILPMLSSYGRMLKKDLLYTAVTRASQSLSLVGEPEAFIHSLQSQQNLRNTSLKERLESEYSEEISVKPEAKKEKQENEKEILTKQQAETKEGTDFILTKELIESFDIDPMIGMNHVKP